MKTEKEKYLEYYRAKAVITPLKKKAGKQQITRKTKKARKKKLVTNTLQQRQEAYAKEKKRRLKLFESWDAEKCNSMILRFEELVRSGQSHRNIAALLGYKHPDDLKCFVEEQYSDEHVRKPLKQIYQSIKAKMDTPTEEWRKFPKGRYGFKTRVALGFCPIVSSDERSVESRKYPPVRSGDTFCKNLEIIPDMSVQPIKRLRKAVHSFDSADWWKTEHDELELLLEGIEDKTKEIRIRLSFKYKNKNKLLKSLSIAFCETKRDKFITHEGGIIINKNFAETENIHPGDKLLGLHGLKGIVCEVRHISTDLLINKNQIWGLKSSSMMGGAVLEFKETGTLKCFFQSAHKVQTQHYKEDTGRICGSAKISPPARFSPDLVPFLVQYLGYNVMRSLTKSNRDKLKDVLRLLNLSIEDVNGYIQFNPLMTLPIAHEGGKLMKFGEKMDGFFYAQAKYEPHLSKETITYGDKTFYPFLLKKLWIPDWLEEGGYLKYFDKKREIWRKTDLCEFLTQEYERKTAFKTTLPVIQLLYKQIYGSIENSIGYLIAIPKHGEPNIITLSVSECRERDIEEDEEVLVWRPPVVSARMPFEIYSKETKHSNILKLKVKYGAEPKTALINTATMRLMFGDFDGDALYIMKIPKEAGNDLRPGQELTKEIEDVEDEIEKIDDLNLPTTKREILLAMRRAFIKEENLKGGIKKKTNLDLIPTKNLRNTTVILHEAMIKHQDAAKESKKITEIGGLTKWGWMAASKDEIDGLIKAIQSLEVMKDRPGKDTSEYDRNELFLRNLKEKIHPSTDKTLSKKENVLLKQYNFGYEKFVSFLSKSSYHVGVKDKAPSYGTLRFKRLCPSKSMIGKWVLVLSQ